MWGWTLWGEMRHTARVLPRQRRCPEAPAPTLSLLQPPILVWERLSDARPAVGAQLEPALHSRLLTGRHLSSDNCFTGLPLPLQPAHP